MKLSEHFTLEEFTYSDVAKKYGINNNPSELHKKTLVHTCQYLLEPLRALMNVKYKGRVHLGKKITYVYFNVTSGYRSNALNSALLKEGYFPSKTSQHCTGEAVDGEFVFVLENGVKSVLDYRQAYKDVLEFVNLGLISVDQCIQEKQGSSIWLHISHSASGKTKDRKQFFTISK